MQHYPNTKPDRDFREMKVQTINLNYLRWKKIFAILTSQILQCIKRIIQSGKMHFIPSIQHCFSSQKPFNVIYYINRLQNPTKNIWSELDNMNWYRKKAYGRIYNNGILLPLKIKKTFKKLKRNSFNHFLHHAVGSNWCNSISKRNTHTHTHTHTHRFVGKMKWNSLYWQMIQLVM